MCIPLTIWLSLVQPLLADGPIGQQVIDKLNREHFDLLKWFENWNVYMISLRYVEEDSINKEEEGFDV